MSENMYAPPQAALVEAAERNLINASRWKRFVASFIDALTIMLVTVPVMFLTGGFDGLAEGQSPSIGYNLLMGVLGLVAFFLMNFHLLTREGKTIGKKALGIRIVTLEGELPAAGNHLLKRYAVYFLPGQIPFVGQFISLINILFIFGSEKRCAHDYLARTKVVEG